MTTNLKQLMTIKNNAFFSLILCRQKKCQRREWNLLQSLFPLDLLGNVLWRKLGKAQIYFIHIK